jgi:ribosomal protein S16
MKNGAQTSDTVYNFLVQKKIIEGKKKNVLSKKAPTKARKELKKA